MYELVEEGDSIIVTFKAIGMLSDGDYDSLSEDFDKLLAKHDYFRVLVDWENLEGWEPGAKTASSWFGRTHHDLVQRMAVVADDKWKDEILRLRDVVAPTEVRHYQPSKRSVAMKWLKES